MSSPRWLGLVASLLTVSCLEGDPNPYAQPVGGTGPGPTELVPGAACSVNSNTAASLTLTNRSAYTLNVFWVDYACSEQLSGNVAPGQAFSTNTSATHPFRLRDATSNALLFEYVTTTAPQQNVDVTVR
jgi:hypothetical protein